jgi:hypothetical protein
MGICAQKSAVQPKEANYSKTYWSNYSEQSISLKLHCLNRSSEQIS